MTGFGARTIGKALAAVLLWAGIAGPSPAAAQTPPPYDSRDENSVDRVTGRFSTTMPESGIGDVAMVRYQGLGSSDNWNGGLWRTSSGATQYATVDFGKVSERFTKSGANWVADKGNGATLVENTTDMQFTYRAPDGTVIVYMSPLTLATTTLFAEVSVPQCGGYNATVCAVPVAFRSPTARSSR